MSTHNFWIVQRLDLNTRPEKGWFDHKFELDYMGSSEFEFGASHDSLKRMHEVGDFVIAAVELTRKGVTKTAFCVAPAVGLEQKLEDFTAWASQDWPRSMETTHFDRLFDENFEFMKREYIKTVAWWSLHDGFLWTLDREVAEQLLHGLKHPATA